VTARSDSDSAESSGSAESRETLERLGLELPDTPRWVEAHGLLAEAETWHRAWPGGGVIGHDRAELAIVLGRCELAAAAALLAAHPALTILGAGEAASRELAARLGRHAERAILHTLPEALEPTELQVAVLETSHALDDLPDDLRAELEGTRAARRVWTAWVEGRPVSFAYASWRSPRFFDVSVDTLPGYRQLGLGEMTARALILDEQAQGRAAVWGATESNAASLRLAARLGFVAVDELWVIAARPATTTTSAAPAAPESPPSIEAS
jgi:GNAT acetyltransferase